MSDRHQGTSALTLTLVCHDPPPAERDGQTMEFGAQDKAGTLHPGRPAAAQALYFTLRVTMKVAHDDETVDVAGPFVHGPPAGRFCYLGYRPVGATGWVRRWKIPLGGITSAQVAAAQALGQTLVAHLSATSGSTVQLLGQGWVVAAGAGGDTPA